MKKVRYILFLVLIILLFMRLPIESLAAERVEVVTINEEELAEVLGGEGVTISNVKIQGMSEQIGYFEGANSYIKGFENLGEGIVLSTGDATQIFKSSNRRLSRSCRGGNNAMPDDTAIIEFDAVSESDFISFQYLFASEEFDQAAKFNDCFHLYVNGENIAKIPGTEDTIAMETFRTQYPNLYYDNGKRGNDYGFFLGYSTLLSCQAKVTPGETNKFRIDISDVGDYIMDSAVFIKANSISKEEAPEIETNSDSSSTPTIEKDPNQKIKVEKEVSKVKLTMANGNIINKIELKDGKSLNELKSAFIVGDIYLITDNEILQGACLEIEYKIKVKNNSDMPCTELLIEDYLDSGLICQTENWGRDEKNNKIIRFYQTGDSDNPAIKPHGEYETTMVASRILTTSSKEYEFSNKARALVINRNIKLTSEVASSQTVNVIPPFGRNTKINFLIIGLFSIIFVSLFWKLKKRE